MSKQKIIYVVLLILAVVFSFLSWQNLEKIASNKIDSYETFWILPSINFLILGITLGLLILLFDSWGLVALAFAVAVGMFLIIFGMKLVYLAGLIIGLAFMVLAIRGAIKEKNVRIKIVPAEILKPALGMIFTVLALIISLVLYFSPPAQDLGVSIKIPRPLFDFIVNSMTGFLKGQLQTQINQSMPLPLSVPNLPPINLNDIEKSLGGQEINVDKILNQEAKDNPYQTLNQQLNFFLQPYKRFLPYGFAVAAFFGLKVVSFIFVWVAIGIIQGIFILMRNTKLINIKKETVEKEVIEI